MAHHCKISVLYQYLNCAFKMFFHYLFIVRQRISAQLISDMPIIPLIFSLHLLYHISKMDPLLICNMGTFANEIYNFKNSGNGPVLRKDKSILRKLSILSQQITLCPKFKEFDRVNFLTNGMFSFQHLSIYLCCMSLRFFRPQL